MGNLADIAFLSGVISFITMICFFVMGGNIGAIKRELREMRAEKPKEFINYTDPANKADLFLRFGEKEKALDLYYESLFLVEKILKQNPASELEKKNKEAIEKKIKELKGHANQDSQPIASR